VAAARQTAKKITAGKPTTGGKTCRNIFSEKVWDKAVEWLQLTGADEVEWDQVVPLAHVEVPPFPTDALPSWCADFVNGISHAMQTPPDLAGGFILSGLSLALARKFRVFVRKGFYERVNIYTVCILPPAERKSPVFEAVFRCIEDYEQTLIEELAPTITAAETSFKILEARVKRTQADAAAEKTDALKRLGLTQQARELAEELRKTKIQVAPGLIADDCTPQRLITLICEQEGRMAELSPEGGIFDIMAGRYAAKGKPPNIDVYLKAHSGDTLRVDRTGRLPDHVRDPALTVGLAVQPAVLRSLVSNTEFRGRGLLTRFLYLVPVSRLGSRDTTVEGIDEAVQATYDRNLKQLLRLDYERDADGSQAPHILRFDESALRLMQGREAEIEPTFRSAAELGNIADWGGKLFGATARFAALLHMTERVKDANPWRSPICAKTTVNAIRLARYFIVHAQAAFSEMGADPAVEKALLIFDWIRRHGLTEFSKRDAQQILKGRLFPSAELDAPLLLLVEHGYIRAQVVSARRHRGRPSGPRFEVNPNIGDSGGAYQKNGPSGQAYPKVTESSVGERGKDRFIAPDTTPQYPINPQNSDTGLQPPTTRSCGFPEGGDEANPSDSDEEEDLT
jgi:replicative DNA helicase